jgi:putative transposase
MTAWLTLSEYLEATGISRRTFFRKRNTIEAKTIDGTTKFSAASLTQEQRAKLEGGLAKQGETAVSATLTPLFGNAESTLQASRIALSPEGERQANERLAIIQPLLDFAADPAGRSRFAQLKLKDGRKVTTADLLASYLAELHSQGKKKISRATLWNWKKKYSAGGINALAREVRTDKGSSKWFTRYPRAAQVVASVWLKPYQTVSSAHSTLLRESQLLGIPPNDLPSYETVRNFLETIPKPIAVLARQGERAYTERMTPYVKRGYTDIPANHLWVADHMIHDVEVRNDCFEGVAPNAPMRLRFSGFQDMRSRKFVGYCWAPEGNSRVITTAIRRGIERYGPPEIVYCDNGADYKKVAKYARPVAQDWREEEYNALAKTGVLQRLGIAVQFCMPYHPQSKLIERAFRSFHLKFDALFPHYTTGNAYNRPDQTVVAMIEHRKLLRMGDGASSPLVPASMFIQMATVWIEEDYNAAHRHKGEGMNGRTPDEVFNELYPLTERRTTDPLILSQLLFQTEKRRVRECTVTLNGRRYAPANPSSSAVMHLANESEVLICYDPHALDQAVIADLDGRMIAEVRAEILLPHSADAQPMIAASMKERRRLRNATVSTVRQIHQGVAMLGHKSDLQLLHERAQLPAAVGDSIVHRLTPPPTEQRASSPRYAHDIANQFFAEGE